MRLSARGGWKILLTLKMKADKVLEFDGVLAQFGRAPHLQCGGSRFETVRFHLLQPELLQSG